MGSELVDGSSTPTGVEPEENSTPLSSTEIFYKHLPYYLAIGMTYEQYFDGDCLLVKYYREAEEIKRKQMNERLWLQGLYIYEALCDVSPLLHAFRKDNTKPVPYTKEPYPITKKEIEAQQRKIEQERYERIRAAMLSMAYGTNQKRKHEGGKQEDAEQ